MSMNERDRIVNVTTIKVDDRVFDVQRSVARQLAMESGYTELKGEQKADVDRILETMSELQVEDIPEFESVAHSILKYAAPKLAKRLPLVLKDVVTAQADGVLVIYTGGTIGSAPKDPDDPDSPQIVKGWSELKKAAPNLGLLGYRVDAVSFVEPLDSCNVGPLHWKTMVRIIEENYDRYQGFVILHGTDTLVYTASALSFMLLYLTKPVVVTGSQVAGIVNPRNDAHQNMISAIMLANPRAHGIPVIPEVIVSFGNVISRGNRTKKLNVVGYRGFNSPNYPQLGESGEFVTIERKHVASPPDSDLQVLDQLETNVIMLEMFPGMQDSQVLNRILQDESLRGVVLKSYGAGNIPTDSEFLGLFKGFIDRGGVVVNVTSVPEGEVVMGLYETSQLLLDRGIIGGFDMTPEAAMCKLMMLLGTYGDDIKEVRRLMQQSIAGEQRLSLESTEFAGSQRLDHNKADVVLERQELASVPDADRIDKVVLRFKDAVLDPGASDRIEVHISREDGESVGSYTRGRSPEHALVSDAGVGESLAIDLTDYRHLFLGKESSGRIASSHKIGFAVRADLVEGQSFSWNGAELNIFTTE